MNTSESNGSCRDADGHIAIWSLTTFRPLVFAKVHAASVLTVHEWENDKFLTCAAKSKEMLFSD